MEFSRTLFFFIVCSLAIKHDHRKIMLHLKLKLVANQVHTINPLQLAPAPAPDPQLRLTAKAV